MPTFLSNSPRAAGILLPVASLPGSYGCGGFGDTAYAWIDLLAECGVSYWQILPIHYSATYTSPYLADSSFAKHHIYIDPERLVRLGLVPQSRLGSHPLYEEGRVTREALAWKEELLHEAFSRYCEGAAPELDSEYRTFVHRNFFWLYDFAVFVALREQFGAPWQQWPEGLRGRNEASLREWEAKLADTIEEELFIQFLLDRQWQELRDYAYAKGVRIIGDLPVYSATDSAEVWSHPQYYALKDDGYPSDISGYPPYFGFPSGQVWGTPVYTWDAIAADGYEWILGRVRGQFGMVDVLRIDHFLGYFKYWAIPSGAAADAGRWQPAPGLELFARLHEEGLPLIVENLGEYNAEAEQAITTCDVIGMRLISSELEFGQGGPGFMERYPEESVVYSGTHDSPPMNGWLAALPEDKRQAFEGLLAGGSTEEPWQFRWIRPFLASPARLVMLPIQDVLGMGGEARINTPGTPPETNWNWRLAWKDVRPELMTALGQAVRESRRNPRA